MAEALTVLADKQMRGGKPIRADGSNSAQKLFSKGGNSKKVLLLEPDTTIRTLLQKVLVVAGYQPVIADPEDCLSTSQTADVIIVAVRDRLDLGTVADLHFSFPDKPLLLTSGMPLSHIDFPCNEIENCRFLRKPYLLEELLAALDSFQNGTGFSGQILRRNPQ